MRPPVKLLSHCPEVCSVSVFFFFFSFYPCRPLDSIRCVYCSRCQIRGNLVPRGCGSVPKYHINDLFHSPLRSPLRSTKEPTRPPKDFYQHSSRSTRPPVYFCGIRRVTSFFPVLLFLGFVLVSDLIPRRNLDTGRIRNIQGINSSVRLLLLAKVRFFWGLGGSLAVRVVRVRFLGVPG